MNTQNLLSISPLDGRYNAPVSELREICSEHGLIKYRVFVEIRWFIHLSQNSQIKDLPRFKVKDYRYLTDIVDNFNVKDSKRIKTIESKTNHDVKAVEYFIKERFAEHKTLKKYSEFIHFACTSEDINNLSYALMIKDATDIINNSSSKIAKKIKTLANKYKKSPMLSRTHGQSASPTTMGKEFSNFYKRIVRISKNIDEHKMVGKINGAVGNYNAHSVAYPEVDWEKLCEQFVKSLKLDFNSHTTQIEPKDTIALLLGDYVKLNNVLIDLSRDIWGYISLGYFKQKLKEGEVGSSTMPHKVNPIDFENAEGNFGLANALLSHISNTVTISRWQRDLTDSTVMRNIGSCLGYKLLALNSLSRGLDKLELNKKRLDEDLNNSWEVLTEAIQTILRKNHIPNGYELMKDLSRGKEIKQLDLINFVDKLNIPTEEKERLLKLTPQTYIGYAEKLSKV